MKKALIAAAAASALAGGCVSVEMNSGPAGSTTQATRAVVAPFMEMFCTRGQVRAAFMRYMAEDYIQHNPNALDGRDAAIAHLEAFAAANPERTCEVQRLIVDGNLAAAHVRAMLKPGERPLAIVDIFRVENGRIAEHWDVVQPTPEASANPHPMF
ncbi:MAG: nuclear transport factor 2 family protein [Hyphomonadaceae bacterium]|nr:nuclear transport factor 2 family protein [Hyphomonadaceae bacterium]